MKRAFKNILAILLAANVLFASTGVVVASHICAARKKADVTLFKSHGCCSKEKKDCSSFPFSSSDHFRNNCCQLNISYYKLDVNSVQKNFSAKPVVLYPAIQTIFYSVFSSLSSHDPVAITHDDGNSWLVPGSKDFIFSLHRLQI